MKLAGETELLTPIIAYATALLFDTIFPSLKGTIAAPLKEKYFKGSTRKQRWSCVVMLRRSSVDWAEVVVGMSVVVVFCCQGMMDDAFASEAFEGRGGGSGGGGVGGGGLRAKKPARHNEQIRNTS